MGKRQRARGMVRAILEGDDSDAAPQTADAAFIEMKDRLVEAEVLFLDALREKRRARVWRHGWPDFLLQDPDTGRFYCVEVKAGADVLSLAQRRTFAALEAMGTPTYVWTKKHRDRLIPWRKFRGGNRTFSPEQRKQIRAAWCAGEDATRRIARKLDVDYDVFCVEWDAQCEDRGEFVLSDRPKAPPRSAAWYGAKWPTAHSRPPLRPPRDQRASLVITDMATRAAEACRR